MEMNIVVFGATGTVGRQLVAQALEQGHVVTAVARRPQKLEILHPNLKLYPADVFDPDAVDLAVKGADAVMIALGAPGLAGTVRSQGTRHIVDAMKRQGVRRLICQSTLGAGPSRGNLDFFWKYLMFGILLRAVMKDHERQEDIVMNSGLDWTIVRPAAFTDGPVTDLYKYGFAPRERQLALKISRADVASFMLKQLGNNRWLHQAPGLSY